MKARPAETETPEMEIVAGNEEEDMSEPCAALPRSSLMHKRFGDGYRSEQHRVANPMQTLSKMGSLLTKMKAERQYLSAGGSSVKSKARQKDGCGTKCDWRKFDAKFEDLMEELRTGYEQAKKVWL